MEIYLGNQLTLLLYSFVCGALLSVFYDAVRVTRMLCGVRYRIRALPEISALRLPLLKVKAKERNGRERCDSREEKLSGDAPEIAESTRRISFSALSHGILIFAGDVFFCIVASAIMLIVFFNFNDGRIRLAALISAAAGFTVCHFTVGSAVMLCFGFLILGLKIAFRYLAFLLWLPVRYAILPAARFIRGCSACLYGAVRCKLLAVRAKRYTANEIRRAAALAAGVFPAGEDFITDTHKAEKRRII